MIKTQTLKGFRDFLPIEAIKRQYVIGKMKDVFERFGFDPLETPALEYAEVLQGKYGAEADKLLYVFEDRGGRKVGLRYDQTVPLARVFAQYNPQTPFKRYQIQPVWRAENPQKGRFREFLQCDIDILGSDSPNADLEAVLLLQNVLQNLGFGKFFIEINDRTLFGNIPLAAITILDKLSKIGPEGVKKELQEKNFDPNILAAVKSNTPTERLKKIMARLPWAQFNPTLARGLDYYTSTIFEARIEGYEAGSVAGGGRYDKLIGQFTGRDMPAVGFAFGFDRLIEAMEQFNLLPPTQTATRVFVATFENTNITLVTTLRNAGINTESYFEPAKLDKQLKYADRKGIPFVIIAGPSEIQKKTIILKNMKTKLQEELTIEEVIKKLQ